MNRAARPDSTRLLVNRKIMRPSSKHATSSAASNRRDGADRSLGRKMIEGTWQKGCKGLGVSRIRGVVKAFNKASVYSFMKAGFTNKGQIEVSGEECLIFEIGSNG